MKPNRQLTTQSFFYRESLESLSHRNAKDNAAAQK